MRLKLSLCIDSHRNKLSYIYDSGLPLSDEDTLYRLHSRDARILLQMFQEDPFDHLEIRVVGTHVEGTELSPAYIDLDCDPSGEDIFNFVIDGEFDPVLLKLTSGIDGL